MQSENLNETFLKKARKAKERFQRQKDKKIQYISDKKLRTEISIRTVYKRNKKERASHVVKARKTLYRQSIKLFYLI